MDEQPEPSWPDAIRAAVKEFVDAVNDSSKELAQASERFAIESLQAADMARSRSEQSAASSAEMAEQARQAAEEARNATAGLLSAVDEAREQVRNEARLSIEQVSVHANQINELGSQIKSDLQQRIEEMVARLEAGTAGHNEAAATAEAATQAARDAAARIEASVSAVEAAVAGAREAAEEARKAADKSEQTAGSVTLAVSSAQEAAESSRQSASLAEQAGQRSDFAAEASMLLERLETDYSLLTRLVQELHSRISSLSAVSVAAPPPAVAPEADVPIDAYETAVEEDEPATSWQEDSYETTEAQPVSKLIHEAFGAPPISPWPVQPPTGLEEASAAAEAAPESIREPEPQAAPAAPAPSISVFGRVQMTLSPVPDFDRLLSLDSALARIQDVHSVTLADYAREEVTFRVELSKPVSVVEFARQLSETAGVGTEVTEASETSLSIRIS